MNLRRRWTVAVHEIGSSIPSLYLGRFRTREAAVDRIWLLDDQARDLGVEDFWILCTPVIYRRGMRPLSRSDARRALL